MIRAFRRLLRLPQPPSARRRTRAGSAEPAGRVKTSEAKAARRAARKADKMHHAATAASDAYTKNVIERMNAGKPHASLGPQLKEGSAGRARIIFERLVARGVEPTDYLVDLGCGTLRIGAHLIEFLEPDRYFGVDLDQRLLDLGRGMLPAGLVELKRPSLRVISDESLAAIAAFEPQWIFSKGVVQHISPGELGAFFGNISRMAGHRTTIVVQVSKLEETTTHVSPRTWSHSLTELEAEALRAGLIVRESPDPRHRGAKSLILGKA